MDGAGEATLRGSVPNRFVPKTRGNTWCKFLSVNNRTKAYYKEIMGPQNTANLTWSPGMHGFFDSEIVMHFNKRDTRYGLTLA